MLLIHHFNELGVGQLFFKTGRKNIHSDLTRFIPVHTIVNELSFEQRNILLTVYTLTGCDNYYSSFIGIGKKKAFKVMMNSAKELQLLADIGKHPSISREARASCVSFVGLLYGSGKCSSLNRLRMKRVIENKSAKPRKLPPTDASFLLHLLRCTYQLMIWRGSLTALLNLPDPIEFGYETEKDTGVYMPHMVSQPLAPPELLSDLVCFCDDQCNEDCVCSSNEQPCTQSCDCKG